jgi:hypothetical protein
MSGEIPVFEIEGTYELKCRGWKIHSGRSPFCVPDRSLAGKQVMVNGELRTVAFTESFAKMGGIKIGELVGLVFKEEVNEV